MDEQNLLGTTSNYLRSSQGTTRNFRTFQGLDMNAQIRQWFGTVRWFVRLESDYPTFLSFAVLDCKPCYSQDPWLHHSLSSHVSLKTKDCCANRILLQSFQLKKSHNKSVLPGQIF